MIVINYGDDITKITYETLCASDIDTYLRAEHNVALKPNLVVETPASLGATTHPEVVEGAIIYLKEFGVRSIKIIESSWAGGDTKRAFKNCGYTELSKKYDVPLVDLKGDNCTRKEHKGFKLDICNEALSTDFLLNIPVLKAHSQTRLTCCIKNIKGCIPSDEMRRFHTVGLHKPIAHLASLVKIGYNLIDGICGDMTFEEGGTPVVSNRIIAGRDPVMLDSFCAQLIGYSPEEIKHLVYARDFGLGEFFSAGIKPVELNMQNKPKSSPKSNRAAERYARQIVDDSACSVCYSALIYALHRVGSRALGNEKFYIGQGFKGKTGTGIGVGDCSAGFEKCILGCPPRAVDIVKAIEG